MAEKSYYADATALLVAYLGCAPEKRLTFVRECVGSQDEEIDLVKLFAALDRTFLAVEKARGQLASQLATALASVESMGQLALFGGTAAAQRLNDAAQALMAVGEGRLSVNLTTGELLG